MPKNYSYFNCPNVRDPIHRWKICEHLNAASWGPNDGFTDSSLGFLIGFPLKSVGVYLNITDAPTLHSMRKLSSKHTFEYIGCTRSGAEELNIVIARIIEWECIFFLRTNVVSNEGFLNSDFRVFFFWIVCGYWPFCRCGTWLSSHEGKEFEDRKEKYADGIHLTWCPHVIQEEKENSLKIGPKCNQ